MLAARNPKERGLRPIHFLTRFHFIYVLDGIFERSVIIHFALLVQSLEGGPKSNN